MGESLTGYRHEKKRFKNSLGYELNLENPSSFSEKVAWKKIYDRDPLLRVTADKLLVRKYIAEILGEKQANEILIPMLAQARTIDKINFDDLSGDYIIKTNHDSGGNLIIREGQKVRREDKSRLKKLSKLPYGTFKHEWAYQGIKPSFIVERLMLDEAGGIPKDFKFYVFHGKCHLVHVDFDRFTNHTRSLYTPEWKYLKIMLKFPQGPDIPRPQNFEKMLQLAEKLGQDFGFVRVDLYSIGDRIYFGELTHYPGSGLELFTPLEFDFELGGHWHLK